MKCTAVGKRYNAHVHSQVHADAAVEGRGVEGSGGHCGGGGGSGGATLTLLLLLLRHILACVSSVDDMSMGLKYESIATIETQRCWSHHGEVLLRRCVNGHDNTGHGAMVWGFR